MANDSVDEGSVDGLVGVGAEMNGKMEGLATAQAGVFSQVGFAEDETLAEGFVDADMLVGLAAEVVVEGEARSQVEVKPQPATGAAPAIDLQGVTN